MPDPRPRKWTATLSVAGQEHPVPLSSNDTLADQTRVAIDEARRLINVEELGSDACIELFKTTKRDGTNVERSVYASRELKCVVRAQR
jgi:hypothetical protein